MSSIDWLLNLQNTAAAAERFCPGIVEKTCQKYGVRSVEELHGSDLEAVWDELYQVEIDP